MEGSGRKFDSSLLFEFIRVLREGRIAHVLIYGSETMVWREKEI